MSHIPLFLAKMVWPCTSCDVITLWPDMTRSKFFHQKLRKGCPISYAKFQHDPPDSSGCIAEKPEGGVASTPLPGRGLNIVFLISRIYGWLNINSQNICGEVEYSLQIYAFIDYMKRYVSLMKMLRADINLLQLLTIWYKCRNGLSPVHY